MKKLLLGAFALITISSAFAENPCCDPCVPPKPLCEVNFLKWGTKGQEILDGPEVPKGKVWLIRVCGIATDDGQYLEWMMQIKKWKMADKNPCWLYPLHRNVGKTAATPTLAVERAFIMVCGEGLTARVNGLQKDKSICLLYEGWEFDECDLGKLIAAGF